MKKFIVEPYIRFEVGEVQSTEDGYGFKITLFYNDGQSLAQEQSGFQSLRQARISKDENVKHLKNHTFLIHPDLRVEEFFELWLGQIAKPNLSKDVFHAYKVAVRYIVRRYGTMKICSMSEAHVVSVYKGAVECSLEEPEFVKAVLQKALSFAKRVGYIRDHPAKNEMLFSSWFIEDDRLSSSEDIKTNDKGETIWDCTEVIENYMKDLGLD